MSRRTTQRRTTSLCPYLSAVEAIASRARKTGWRCLGCAGCSIAFERTNDLERRGRDSREAFGREGHIDRRRPMVRAKIPISSPARSASPRDGRAATVAVIVATTATVSAE